MIIGLTGTKASGKGVVAEILQEMGFTYSSTSDRVREEAIAKGIENHTIKQLQDLANNLRETFGKEIFLTRTLEKLKGAENSVIDGIRNPGEIEKLREHKGIMIAVDAPLQLRYERLIERKRESDPKDWEGFIAMDRRDKGVGEELSGQQVGRCMEISDYLINNDSTLEQLKAKIYRVLEDIKQKNPKAFTESEPTPIEKQEKLAKKIEPEPKETQEHIRPSWDEYFMEICDKVSERGTCNRGKGGAVIVRNKRILTTGYMGPPPGIEHCDEVGHLLKTVTHEDGTQTTHCRRTIHCELNAILQAAKMGIGLEGSTLYTFKAPCRSCAMAIISTGIKRVIAKMRYHADFDTAELFEKAGVKFDVLSQEVSEYKNM